jgi:hypothetical protein
MIAGDEDKLKRTMPGFTEFRPRVGFAYDPRGEGRIVIRGIYGIFYDQIFQNLTLFSTQQMNPTAHQTVLDSVNSQVGVGDLANFRFGLTRRPPGPPTPGNTDLGFGASVEYRSFGRWTLIHRPSPLRPRLYLPIPVPKFSPSAAGRHHAKCLLKALIISPAL